MIVIRHDIEILSVYFLFTVNWMQTQDVRSGDKRRLCRLSSSSYGCCWWWWWWWLVLTEVRCTERGLASKMAQRPPLLCGSSSACSIIGFYARQFRSRRHFSARRRQLTTPRRLLYIYMLPLTSTCRQGEVYIG